MSKKHKLLLILSAIIVAHCLVIGIHYFSMEKVTFINTSPIIKMNDKWYIVTKEILTKDKLGRQVGRVTKYVKAASYIEEPYKNPSKVYEIKDKSIDEEVALKMNGENYLLYSRGD